MGGYSVTIGDTAVPTAGSEQPDVQTNVETGPPAPDEAASDGGPHPEDDRAPHEAAPSELTAISLQLAALVAETTRWSTHAEAREQVIVHQRDELDTLRAERAGTHLRPLVVGLAKLRAELLTSAADAVDGRHRGLFEYYADSVEAVLERSGVERLPVEPGDVFDPAGQSAVRSVDVDPAQHRTIVAVLADGWAERDSGRVFAPAKVVVGRHLPPAANHENQEPSDV